ncbi:hypothetical protein MOC17_20475 [Bacillus haynesii]|uniref:hypothetical protein n=1 Tax=Bacillus haynesii TaxID=1925021 RepID=UPI00227E8268|nr:hypothetical protein [Bacillus haynesii]MCY8048433.1 hypothetical protein [Bacillus haynesii]
MSNMYKEVYIKFGAYHGVKALIIGEISEDGEPAFLLQVAVDRAIVKKQRNTVFVNEVQK